MNKTKKLTLLALVVAMFMAFSSAIAMIMPSNKTYATDTAVVTTEADLTISTADELKAFADAVNAGDSYEGKLVVLANDIDLQYTAVIIGTKANPFKGTFDGQGHIVSNFSIYENGSESDYFADSDDCIGLFGVINTPAVVKNVTVDNPDITGSSYVGGIVGMAYTGKIENCHVTGEIDIEGYYMVGGITGHGYAKIYGCSVIGAEGWNYNYVGATYKESDLEGDNVGGIVGHNAENNDIHNCTVKNVTVSGTRKVGGIVGITNMATRISGCKVDDVIVETTATEDYANDNVKTMSIGGIVGQYQNSGSAGVVSNCSVSGLTFVNENNVTVSAGAVTGGMRGTTKILVPTSVVYSLNITESVDGANGVCETVGVAEATEVATSTELVAAIANGGVIKLTDDITTTAAIKTVGVTAIIDLNGKTLTIGVGDNKFEDESNITIKNGNINITGVTVKGNAIFCLDEYEKTLKTVMTLKDVNLTGNGYSSAYGIFYIGDSSELNVIGGEWNLTNDTHASGGVFKADASGAVLNVSGTEMTLHNVRRVVTYAATVIEDSTITVTGDADGVDAEMEHGFNRSPLTIKNSTVTMTDMVGRGITAENGAVSIENSTVSIKNAKEATIDVRNNQTVTVDTSSTVTLDKAPIIANGSSINGTVAVVVAEVNGVQYTSFEDAIAAVKAGETITLLNDVTLSAETTIPAGVTINGNGKTINGSIVAGGDITFAGHTKVTSFNAGYSKSVVTIGEGACLELIGTGRMVIGHGATFNITGSIVDAKTADTAKLTPSLIMPGASFTGAGVTFNVTNAYIKTTASYCSSSKSASGTFDFNIENSIWEQFGKLAFEAQSTAATVNFELKDSVLTTTSHLVFGVSKGEIVIDNSNVNVGTSRQIENQSTMTVKNGSVVNGLVATSSNAKNPGTLIVDNATYAVTGEFSGSDLGTGTLIVKNGASFSAGSITKANIQIDATGMDAGEVAITANLANLAGTLEVINNSALKADIVDGKIVLVERTLLGAGTAEDPYLINNIDDLKFFRNSVNNGKRYNGQFVKLNADIDLNDEEWTPIGDRNVDQGSFLGTFDGGDHIISNLWISEWTKTGAGFFSKVGMQTEYVSGTVKNVTFNNVTIISNESYVGVIAQAPSGALIENVHIIGDVTIQGYGYVGGIVGHGYPTINNCSVIANEDSQIIAHYWGAGAILGFAGDYGAKISGATVKGVEIFADLGGAASVAGSPYGAAITGEITVKDVTITSNSDYCMSYIAGGGNINTKDITMENVTATANGNPITPGDAVASVNGVMYFDLQAAIDAAQNGETVTLLKGLTIASDLNDAGKGYFNIADGKNVTLDLNGKKITATDNSTGNFILFYSYGEFTIKNGTIELTATNDRDWNAESAIILNRGGVLNVVSGTYKHLGGTDMAFVVDNSGNWYGDATTNIGVAPVVPAQNAISLFSTSATDTAPVLASNYIAIRNRMEQNSHGASGTTYLNVYDGTIRGTSRAIWAQAASVNETHPATGAINVSGGNIGLIDTARSIGAVSMTTITGGTVSAVKAEVGELTVKGGTVEDIILLNTAGEEVVGVQNADGVYVQAVAAIGEKGYATLAEAIVAAQANDTITLLADATISATTNINKSIIINGNGKKITQADGFTYNGSNAMFDIMSNATVTFKNITFDGFKDAAIMRTVNANVVIENCIIQNSVHTVAQGLLRLACGNATITNSKFLNNDCTLVITFGYDAANETDELVIDNCLFEGNNASETAIVYFADGGDGTITNTKFINNTVKSAGNAATLYMGWGAGYQVTGCYFEGNKVTTSHATTKRFASAIFCDGCEVTNNAFVNNTATRNGEAISTTVAVGAYYGPADLSGNYWGGSEPIYTVEFDNNTVANTNYYTDYSIDADGNVVLNESDKVEFVAIIGTKGYKTFAEAYNAAQPGDTITLLADVKLTGKLTIAKGITIDGNGHSIIADETATWYTGSGFNKKYIHLIGVNADNITLKDVVLDCNNNAAGINVYCAQNVVFDNVSIINATKGMAALTVNGSTLTTKNAFTALGCSVALDISNGKGVTSELGITVEEGTVFDLGNNTVKFASVANVDTLSNAVNADGDKYFAAMDNAYFYTKTQIINRTTAFSNGLTLLDNLDVENIKVKGTLDLNGYTISSTIMLEKGQSLTAPEGLNVVTNAEGYQVVYKDGKYTSVKSVAKIGDTYYATLEDAFKAATSGCTIYILTDVTISDAWDCRYNGAKFTVPVTIEGVQNAALTPYGMPTITLTGAVDDKNWNTIFRFEANATVKNLVIDASEANGVQRGISAKYSITVDTCFFIGNVTTAKRAIIFGEGAGDALPTVTATIKNSAFLNWSYGVSDNQSGKDAKSVEITACDFGNASALISASESVTFTGNKLTNGYASISSYTNYAGVKVTATGNTLYSAFAEYNTINAKAENVNAEGFMLPVAKINGKAYFTLAKAVEKASAGDVITVIANVSDEAITVDKNLTITGNVTLNNVSINAVEGCTELTVSGFTFAGNSWINSGAADKLTVSGVKANVTPSNAAYTNSRSAFISLGRSEGQKLELVVENSSIVSAGGSDPILGWASITKATITNNTFGSADAHQNNSDSVKFMAIADGAVFTITGNTVYSDYNGFVFGQNTTRDNAYSVVLENNTFVGGADHVWVEVSGAKTTHATINASSTNTVNGEAFTKDDIKVHPNINTWTSYAGVDVETNENGKVIGGSLAFYAEDIIAEGYVVEKDGTVRRFIKVTYADGTVEYFSDMLKAVPYTTNCPRLEGATITLLADVAAPGLRFMENDMVFDLNGFTYTITAGTGSQGTNTSGFQIRPEVTTNVIFKNGTIKVAEGAPVVWMFNCYATKFIVENVTVDCTNMAYGYGENVYVSVSRVDDNVQFLGNTEFINFNSDVAGAIINVGDTMTIADTVKFNGKVELDAGATLYMNPEKHSNVEVITADGYSVEYNNGVYTSVKNVASVNGKSYATLEEAFKAATSGATITILDNVTIDYYWDCRYTGSKFTVPVTIDGNGKTLKFTNTVYDGGNHYTVFRFEADATVENLTIDMSKALSGFNGRFRAISAKADLTVDNCTFIGNGSANNTRAIIYGESAGSAISSVEISITNSTFNAWRRGVSDNENAQDAKTVTVTGNTFNDASAYISASESVTFTGNTLDGGWVNITSYAKTSELTVNATGNTLEDNDNTNFNIITNAVTVNADKGFMIPVAEVNGKAYFTLQSAVDKANAGDVVKLLSNATAVTVSEGKTITIDLNGNDIVGETFGITNNGTLTINDTVGTGKVYTTDVSAQGRPAILNNVTGVITINAGWFGDSNNDTTDRNAINRGNAIKNYGKATINGGYFTNVSNQYIGTDAYAYAINTLASGNTIINNATVYGDINGLIFSDGKTIVNDGSFTLGRPNEENNLWYLAYGDVEIKGGTWNRAFKVPSWNAGDPKFSGDVVVSNGTFNVSIPKQYLAEGRVIAKKEGLFAVGVMPNAEVANLGAITVTNGTGANQFEDSYYIYDLVGSQKLTSATAPFALQVAMKFTANDTLEQAQANVFSNYTTDFFIQINGIENGSFVANGCYIAGYYPSFDAWVVIPLDGFTIEDGKVYPVITSAGFDFKYTDICDAVGEFTCGIYLTPEVLAANPNLTVGLDLGLSETKDEALSAQFNKVDGYKYEAEELATAFAAKIGDMHYTTFAEAYNAAQTDDTITLLADVELSEILVIDKAITLDGNGKTLTSTAERAINVSGADGATIKNLTINASGERAINVIQNATNVKIENVTATASNYTVNVAASAPNAVVEIKDSTLNGLCTVNVAAANAEVTVTDSTINCNDNNTTLGEVYAAVSLNKEAVNGTITVTNSTINVAEGSDSHKARNGAEGGIITIDGSTDGVIEMVAVITYEGSSAYYSFATLQAAIDYAKAGETVTLIRDVKLSEILVIDKAITLDGNGKTLTSTAGRAINVSGADGVTIKNLTINASGERAINVIQNATNVTIENVTATASNYAVNVAGSAANAVVEIKDSKLTGLNVVNVGADNVKITINDTTIICNDNSDLEAYGAITVGNSGNIVTGVKVTMNGGEVVVDGDSTAGVMIAEESEIIFNGTEGNTTIKQVVALVNGGGFFSLANAIDYAKAGETVTLIRDVELANTLKVVAGKDITLDLNGKVISGTCNVGQTTLIHINNGAKLTVKDSSMAQTGKITFTQGTSNVGWTIYLEGKLDLASGNIELTGDNWNIGYAVDVRPNAWGAGYTEPTVFTMNGGKIVSSDGAVRVASSSADGYTNISASFVMNGGAIEAAWDGVFVQQSNAIYDVLNFTMNGGSIASALNPIRVYGGEPTGYVNGEDCINITLNGGALEYTGTEQRTWLIENVLRVGGGMMAETLLANGDVTVSETVKANLTLAEGYKFVEENGTYKVQEIARASVAYRAYINDSASREAIQIDLANVLTRESLVIELYDANGNLLTTTSLKAGASKANALTANVVLWGSASGSWDTVINAEKLTVANAPAVIKLYADGVLVDTYENAFGAGTNVDETAKYLALDCVYKEAMIGETYYATLADAFNAAVDRDTVKLVNDIALNTTVENDNEITLDLNGKTITGTDNNMSGNFYLINNNKGNLTITDSVGGGKITLTATNERNWLASSVVVANNLGTVTVKAGTIEHLGGTSMAYGIDNLTNGKNTVATLNIEGGKIDSTYFAIRQFANNGTNNLNVTGGEISYAWMQSPNANANVANISVTGGTIDGICLTGKNAVLALDVAANTTGLVYGTAPVGIVIVGSPETGFGIAEAVALIGDTYYASITDAINAANDGDTVQILAGTYDEYVAPWVSDTTHASEKSITIVGAENFGTILTGGMYLGYDDSGCRAHTITVKGIAFEGKGLVVAGQQYVVIENNKFTDINTEFVSSGTANINAISVVGKNINATVTGNVINGAEVAGINLRNIATATVTGNTITNTKHNSITLNTETANAGTVVIENNVFSNWGSGVDAGRAIRVAGGETITVNGNVMTMENAPEEFVKITKATTIDVSENYWNGVDPTESEKAMFATDSTTDAKELVKTYYTDVEKTNLVEVAKYVVKIGDKGYTSLAAAINAANAGETITLIEDITLTESITVADDKVVTLDINGKVVSMADASNAGCYMIKNYGNLTIIDSVGTGKLTFNSTTPSANFGYSTSTIGNAGNLVVESGIIENTTVGGASYAIDTIWYNKDVSIIIKGGTITANKIAVRQVPFSTTYKNVVTVNGGTLTGATAGLQTFNTSSPANLAEVNIKGGTFNGTYAFYTSYTSANGSAGTTINISDGEFNGYVYLYNGIDGGSAMNITVTDGQFNGGYYAYTYDVNGNEVGIPSVKGGTFAQDVTNYCANGFVCVKNENGTYGVHEAAAIVAVVYDGDANAIATIEGTDFTKVLEKVDALTNVGSVIITLYGDVTTAETINVKYTTYIHGEGHTITYTGTNRAINVSKDAGKINLMIDHLSVVAENAERGINYNTTGKLDLNYVSVTAGTYAINFPSSANDAHIDIDHSTLTANVALNVWGKNMVITVNESVLTNVDNTAVENYSVIQLNNDGSVIADGTKVTVNGGKVIATGDSYATSNWTATGTISISNTTEVVGEQVTMIAWVDGYGIISLQGAFDYAARAGKAVTVTLIRDITVDETSTLAKGANVTLDLNGHVITGTDNTSKNFSVIENYGTLTIKDSVGTGKITLKATTNNGWNKYSAVISNNPGGKLTVESGLIEHLGGTAMAYGIDNRTNGKGTYAETTINGGTIKSAYIAIRQFLNGVEADNILTVNYGTIDGANCSIYFQDPSANANSGKLVVESTAVLTKRVYLDVTEGSTEWPVTVSIADAAFASDVTERVVAYGVPAGYEVKATDGIWGVTYTAIVYNSYTLTLDGGIGINFYATLGAGIIGDNGAYATLIIDGEVRNTLFIKDLTTDSRGRYKLSVELMSYEMNKDVTVTIYSGEDVAYETTMTRSVRDYAMQAITLHTDSDTAHYNDAKTVALMKAMLNYGAQSQIYFTKDVEDLANNKLDADDQIIDTVAGSDFSHVLETSVTDTKGDDIDVKSVALMLESLTSIRIYLTIADGVDVSKFTVVGAHDTTIQYREVDGRYYVEIENIMAYALDDNFTIEIKDGDTSVVVVSYSVAKYLSTAVVQGSVNMKPLAMAMNIYNKAANVYFNK